MATQTIPLQRDITRGARAVAHPQNLAAVGGFAFTGLAERVAFGTFRGVFGTDDGQTTLTGGQRLARIAFQLGEAVTGGALATAGRGPWRAAGVGMMAGGTWHALNSVGINV